MADGQHLSLSNRTDQPTTFTIAYNDSQGEQFATAVYRAPLQAGTLISSMPNIPMAPSTSQATSPHPSGAPQSSSTSPSTPPPPPPSLQEATLVLTIQHQIHIPSPPYPLPSASGTATSSSQSMPPPFQPQCPEVLLRVQSPMAIHRLHRPPPFPKHLPRSHPPPIPATVPSDSSLGSITSLLLLSLSDWGSLPSALNAETPNLAPDIASQYTEYDLTNRRIPTTEEARQLYQLYQTHKDDLLSLLTEADADPIALTDTRR